MRGATKIGSDNNRLKSSPDYSEIGSEGEVFRIISRSHIILALSKFSSHIVICNSYLEPFKPSTHHFTEYIP